MVFRHCDVHLVVSKSKGKFRSTTELHVLPTLKIAVNSQAGKPLCNGIEIVFIFSEVLIPSPAIAGQFIRNFIIPIALENKFLSWLQGNRHFNPHHGLVNRVGQGSASGICQCSDINPIAIQVFFGIHLQQLLVGKP